MGVTVDNVGLTFTRYLKGVVASLNNKSRVRKYLKRDDNWSGNKIEGRVHTARNTGIGYVEDGGALPVADKQDYQAYEAYRKFLVGSVQVTDGALAAAKEGKNVAKGVVKSEIQGMMEGLMKFENGMFFRDGTGALTTTVGADIASSATDVPVYDARMLWDGATIEFRDSADITTLHGSTTVTSTSASLSAAGNPQVTFGSTVSGVAADDYLVWTGCVNRAVTGLDKLINDSGTFQNINTATYPRYTSLVLDNSGTNRDLTPSLFRQLLAGIMHKSGNDRPDSGLTVFASAWQALNVEEMYEGELRLSPSDKTSGFAISSFQSALGRIDIVVDTDCLFNKIFAVDINKVYRAVQKDLAWRRDNPGGSIFKRSDTATYYTASAIEICELYIKERHTSGKIEDLNQTIVTAY